MVLIRLMYKQQDITILICLIFSLKSETYDTYTRSIVLML